MYSPKILGVRQNIGFYLATIIQNNNNNNIKFNSTYKILHKYILKLP